MTSRRTRRRLIVRRGREEMEEEPFLLSIVCVIFMCPLREKIMRGKSIRCSCSLIRTGLLQGKPGELKKGDALKHLLALYEVPDSRWTFSNVQALNWPVKRMHIAADTSHSSPCLMVSTAETTQPVLYVVFCWTAPGTPVHSSHSDDDFSLGMPCFKIPDSVCNVTQRETAIDNRFHLTGFKQLFHKNQILLVWFMSRVPHFLSSSPRNQWPQEHGLEQLRIGTPGHDIHSLGM